MATRTSDFNYVDSPRVSNAYEATTDTYYKGSGVALRPSTGLVVLWDGTSGDKWLGPSVSQREADETLTPGKMVEVDERGVILKRVAVAGASAITDVGDLVYASDDDLEGSLTKTASVSVGAIGRIVRWYSSTTCDVRLFTPEEYDFREGRRVFWDTHFLAGTFADGDIITTWTPGFAGRIVDIDAICTAAVTTGSKAADINLEIGTTDLTGGLLELSGTYSLGAVVAGTAITAGNHFGASDTISMKASSVTTFAEGSFTIRVHVIPD